MCCAPEFILTPGQGPVFLMSSSGLYNQNQLIFNLNSKVSKSVSIFSSYVLNHALSNTDGVGTFPSNPYNHAGEYGPAAHRISGSAFSSLAARSMCCG